jgi:hypothetical protein
MPSAVLAPPPSQSAKPAANTKPSMVDSEAGEGNGAEEDEEDELDKQLDGLSGGEEDDEELPDTSQLEGGADRFASVLMNIEDRARMQARQDDGRSSSYHDDSRMMVAETPVQPPFTSGCTPLEDGRRQLGWSLVGRASCVERTDHSSIEIEFEDSSRHRRPLQFIDPERCTMGDIGETGALFASPQRGNSMSQLHFRFFDSWDSEGWTCDLDDGEEIVACAFGRQFVVVATSLRNLRVFNLGGTQVFIVATDGAVVSLACSEWDQLAVVTHAGRGLPTEQNLGALPPPPPRRHQAHRPTLTPQTGAHDAHHAAAVSCRSVGREGRVDMGTACACINRMACTASEAVACFSYSMAVRVPTCCCRSAAVEIWDLPHKTGLGSPSPPTGCWPRAVRASPSPSSVQMPFHARRRYPRRRRCRRVAN